MLPIVPPNAATVRIAIPNRAALNFRYRHPKCRRCMRWCGMLLFLAALMLVIGFGFKSDVSGWLRYASLALVGLASILALSGVVFFFVETPQRIGPTGKVVSDDEFLAELVCPPTEPQERQERAMARNVTEGGPVIY